MSKTYFVSGHRDITEEEFVEHYEPKMWKKLNEEGSKFIIGDCYGADDMAQKYLKAMGIIENVTIYHMFDVPRCCADAGFNIRGGFRSDIERDFAMTKNSDEDIAWVKPGREHSGTAKNIERRSWMNERIAKGLSVTFRSLNK